MYFIRYLVSITQVLKDTSFGLDNWYGCAKLLLFVHTHAQHHAQKFDVSLSYFFLNEYGAQARSTACHAIQLFRY
jgi:hypothetical protein